MKAQKAHLKQRVETWCEALRTRKIRGTEAWHCLNVTVVKTLECPLIATSFTPQECRQIFQPIQKIALQMCGLQRNLPKKLLHGPISDRGCGPPDLYTLQAAHHLSVILRHDLKDAHTHNLLQDNVETVQFYAGSDQNFWDLPFPL